MPLELIVENFKRDYIEQKSSQGIDLELMNKHMQEFYKVEPAYSTSNKLEAREQAQQICDHMRKLGMNSFDSLMDKFEENAFTQDTKMVDSIKKTMEGIVYMVDNSNDPATLATQFNDRDFACKEGSLTNLQSILGEMSLSSSGIDSYFIEQKKQLVTQTAITMYREGKFYEFPSDYRRFVGMEIHAVTSLTNSVASEYGLLTKTKEDDKYVEEIFSESHDKLSKAIDNNLKNETVITSMLDGVVMNILNNLPTYNAAKPNKFIAEVSDYLTNLKLIDKKEERIVDVQSLVEMQDYVPKGYKQNIETIFKNALITYFQGKGVMKSTEIDFIKLKVEIEQGAEGNNQVSKDTLDKAQQQGDLNKSIKYIIDNDLKLDFGDIDPVKHAINNNIKIDGKDPKQYGLERTIDQYFKTKNPEKKELLEKKYKEIHQIGEDRPIELLGVNSALGKFVDSPNSTHVTEEYKKIKGQSVMEIMETVDFTKCDLALIEKCVKGAEQNNKEKPRDYDKFSTIQKVGFAVSCVLGPVAAIVYSAIKSHNSKEKKAVENKLGFSMDSISKDLVKISRPNTEHFIGPKEEIKQSWANRVISDKNKVKAVGI